ncbi:hypothetical protein HDU96_001238 [Phlyctochytrium bullatum]|nr:hypothetical protein HDU96_001238 [Phlyctochytrium bullatum]
MSSETSADNLVPGFRTARRRGIRFNSKGGPVFITRSESLPTTRRSSTHHLRNKEADDIDTDDTVGSEPRRSLDSEGNLRPGMRFSRISATTLRQASLPTSPTVLEKRDRSNANFIASARSSHLGYDSDSDCELIPPPRATPSSSTPTSSSSSSTVSAGATTPSAGYRAPDHTTAAYILSLESSVAELTARTADLEARLQTERTAAARHSTAEDALRGELARYSARVEALEQELRTRGSSLMGRVGFDVRCGHPGPASNESSGRAGTFETPQGSTTAPDPAGDTEAALDAAHARIDTLESDALRLVSAKQDADRKLEGLIPLLAAAEARCVAIESDARTKQERLERHVRELSGLLEEERGRVAALEAALTAGASGEAGSPARKSWSKGDRLEAVLKSHAEDALQPQQMLWRRSRSSSAASAGSIVVPPTGFSGYDAEMEVIPATGSLQSTPPPFISASSHDADSATSSHAIHPIPAQAGRRSLRRSRVTRSTPSLTLASSPFAMRYNPAGTHGALLSPVSQTSLPASRGLADALALFRKASATRTPTAADPATADASMRYPNSPTPLGLGGLSLLSTGRTLSRRDGHEGLFAGVAGATSSSGLAARIYDRVIGTVAVHDTPSSPLDSSAATASTADPVANETTSSALPHPVPQLPRLQTGPVAALATATGNSANPAGSHLRRLASPFGEDPLSLSIPRVASGSASAVVPAPPVSPNTSLPLPPPPPPPQATTPISAVPATISEATTSGTGSTLTWHSATSSVASITEDGRGEEEDEEEYLSAIMSPTLSSSDESGVRRLSLERELGAALEKHVKGAECPTVTEQEAVSAPVVAEAGSLGGIKAGSSVFEKVFGIFAKAKGSRPGA